MREIGTVKELLRYRLVSDAVNLSYAEARAMEQILINRYGLARFGGALLNEINSIAPRYWYLYGIY